MFLFMVLLAQYRNMLRPFSISHAMLSSLDSIVLSSPEYLNLGHTNFRHIPSLLARPVLIKRHPWLHDRPFPNALCQSPWTSKACSTRCGGPFCACIGRRTACSRLLSVQGCLGRAMVRWRYSPCLRRRGRSRTSKESSLRRQRRRRVGRDVARRFSRGVIFDI